MRTYFLSAILVLLVALVPAQAAPTACTNTSGADYVTNINAAGGCILSNGNVTFTLKNFAWTTRTDQGYVPLTAANVFVNPTFLNGHLAVDVNSAFFNVTGSDKLEAMLSYLVDPPPPILEDLNLDMDANSPVYPGSAVITAHLCSGGLLVNGCVGSGVLQNMQVAHYGGAPGSTNVLTNQVKFPATNIIDIQLKIQMDGGGFGGSSQFNGVKMFSVIPDATVPEPAGIWLALGGLSGLILARRVCRRAKLEGLAIPLKLSSQV